MVRADDRHAATARARHVGQYGVAAPEVVSHGGQTTSQGTTTHSILTVRDSFEHIRPVITAENFAAYPPPALHHHKGDEARGPGSAPYIWYKQMMGVSPLGNKVEPYPAYDNARKRWNNLRPEVRAREQTRHVRRKLSKD